MGEVSAMWKLPWQLHIGTKDQDIQENLFLPLHLSLSFFCSHYFRCWRPIPGPHVHWANTLVLSEFWKFWVRDAQAVFIKCGS